MKYDTPGEYTLVYKTVDGCGNKTEQIRTVVANDIKTVLFTDGTLIINERSNDRVANILEHGTVVKEYTPAPYYFHSQNSQPWTDERTQILKIKMGGEVPVPTMQWYFMALPKVKEIDLTGMVFGRDCSFLYTFMGCFELEKINTELINTERTMSLLNAFNECFSLETLDLSGMGTGWMTVMENAFQWCSKLKTIYVNENWWPAAPADSKVFEGCESLVGGDGTAYSIENIYAPYAWIDGRDGKPGYMTVKE